MENKKTCKISKPWLVLLILLAVYLICVCAARVVDTNHGTVDIQDVYYTSNFDGALLHGRIYIPETATKENPAPAVIYYHGNDGDCDKYSMIAVELSRRGYVVMLGDIRNQGQSVGANASIAGGDTFGINETAEYIRALSMVDKDNVIVGGHSLGGIGAVNSYAQHPDYYSGLLIFGIGSSMIENGVKDNPNVDVYLVTGRDDNDSVDHTNVARFFGNCDVSEFEPNKVYGSYEEGNARLNYQAMNAVHNSEYVNKDVLASAIDFVQGSAPAPNPIPGEKQVWMWRYLLTTIAFAALLAMLLPLGSILLDTPFFSQIRKPLPEFKGNTGAKWWIYAVLTAVIAPATYFSWTSLGEKWLPLKIFNIRRATLTLGWTLMIMGVTIAILIIGYFITKKEKRPALANYGVCYEKGEALPVILKSLLLSVLLVLGIYSLQAVTYKWTLIDIRIWNSSFRVLNWVRVKRVLVYFLPFALAYTVTAVNLHGTLRPKSGKVSILVEVLVNILLLAPLYYVWMIWFGPFAWLKAHGALPSFSGFMYSFFWALPITMTIIATVSTWFFRKTGRVYLGAFVNAWLVCWTLLGGFSLYA